MPPQVIGTCWGSFQDKVSAREILFRRRPKFDLALATQAIYHPLTEKNAVDAEVLEITTASRQ